MDFFVEEFLCHRRYARAIFHLRPQFAHVEATLRISGTDHVLTVSNEDGFAILSGDFLVPGIAEAGNATVTIAATASDGSRSTETFTDIVRRQIERDPFVALNSKMDRRFRELAPKSECLELGSRRRDDTRFSHAWMGSAKAFVAVDIVDGPGVDIVGDAHRLSKLVGGRQFDLVYTHYVFEHLAMPWVVVSELNKVMRIGAEAWIITNQTMALHDRPWDFWRFSDSTWKVLFNADSGFEILSSALGETMRITPLRYHDGFRDHEGGAGFQGSSVWVKKTADRDLAWGVDPDMVLGSLGRSYPEQITD
jgi:hypothetical protein